MDYVLEGSLQACEQTVRITAQLADARAGVCLWAEQFTLTGPLGTILDDGVIAIIAKLDSRLSVWGAVLAMALILAKDIDAARQQA